MNLVMMGPPGAGKGTQAERLARERGIPKISTGDILREAVSARTEVGLAIKQVMERGALVSDDLIIEIARERLERADAVKGFILDGFPRTVVQAKALDQMMEGRGPILVIEMQVPDAELVRRVQLRRICASCGTTVSAFADGAATCRVCGGELVSRSDDSADVVRKRLEVYWRETSPMIAFYHTRPTFRTVNGAQPPERVREALATAVASAAESAPPMRSTSSPRTEPPTFGGPLRAESPR